MKTERAYKVNLRREEFPHEATFATKQAARRFNQMYVTVVRTLHANHKELVPERVQAMVEAHGGQVVAHGPMERLERNVMHVRQADTRER